MTQTTEPGERLMIHQKRISAEEAKEMFPDPKTTPLFRLHPDNDAIVIWDHGSAGCSGKDARKNASLIVTAMNSHADLVKALCAFSPLQHPPSNEIYAMRKSALAKAGIT